MVERDMVVDRLTIFETLHEGRRGNIVPVLFPVLAFRAEACRDSQNILFLEYATSLLLTVT